MKRTARAALRLSLAVTVAGCGGKEPSKPSFIVVPQAPERAPEAVAAAAVPAGPVPLAVRVAGAVACGSAVCHELDEICCSVEGPYETNADGAYEPVTTHFCAKATEPADPNTPYSMARERECSAKVAKANDVTVFACDEASDCGDEACRYKSAPSYGESKCGGDGGLELCKPESGCRTPGTYCRQGIPCPFFGSICETHGVCVTKTLPTCGAQRCTESAPLCCVSGSKTRCSRDCRKETDLGFPVGTVECSSSRACGEQMDCCVSIGMTSSVCAGFCDIGVQRVVCESDEDCAPYEVVGATKCASAPEGDLKLRFCVNP